MGPQVVADHRLPLGGALERPRRMRRVVIWAKNRSAWLSQDEVVGMTCETNAGRRTNYSRTRGRGCSCVPYVSVTTSG